MSHTSLPAFLGCADGGTLFVSTRTCTVLPLQLNCLQLTCLQLNFTPNTASILTDMSCQYPTLPTLLQGSCGYGDLSDKSQYPFFSAVGIPPNSDIASLPSGGCGTCIEFQCVNDRTPAFAVSLQSAQCVVLKPVLAF